MSEIFYSPKSKMGRKFISSFVATTFLASLIFGPATGANAQYITNLPKPGEMVLLSPAFQPPVLMGMTLHPENPLQFDFIVDRGQDKLSGDALKDETQKLLKYFLAAMTIPDDESWVNLSPYESDRIVPDMLGSTDMGKAMLEQDYLLKQLSASLTNPQEEVGKNFWNTVYKKAFEKFGTTTIPINTFNKVWITPDRAVILEKDGYVLIGETHLKVMLDEDYLSVKENLKNNKLGTDPVAQDKVEQLNSVSSEVVRQIIVPELEKEINEGKNFASVRQMYYSVILATWYKQNLKNSLLGKVYVDKSKIMGVDIADKDMKQKVYDQYLAAFRQGVYNLIKEDYDLASKDTLPRKYFSGGIGWEKASSAITRAQGPAVAAMTRGVVKGIEDGRYVASEVRLAEGKEADVVSSAVLANNLFAAGERAIAQFADAYALIPGTTSKPTKTKATVSEIVSRSGADVRPDLARLWAEHNQSTISDEDAIAGFVENLTDAKNRLNVLLAQKTSGSTAASSSAVSPEKVLTDVLPRNLKLLEAKGLPADSVDYWNWNFIDLLRRENPEAYEIWRAENQHVLSGAFEAPIPVFTEGGNTKFDAAFDDGITINGVKMKVGADKFMQQVYQDYARGVEFVLADANAGFGENLKRQKNLLVLIEAGLIADRPRDANGLPQLLAKSMDTFIPVKLLGGKTVLISVFEQHLLRVIKLAQDGTYKTVSLQQLVNEQSIELVKKYLTNKFPAYAFELLGFSADKIKDLQAKKVQNYDQLFRELGVTVLDPDEYPGLPTVNPETWEIKEGSTANAGHGLVAYRKLHQLLIQGKQLLADQRAGLAVNIPNVVYAFTNGDGPNSWVPEQLVGYVVKEGIGMALIGVPREMVDIKIGAPYRLAGKDSEGNPTDILGAAEIAEVKADPAALGIFLAQGRTPETAGKQWANTNTLIINGKMAMFLAELAEIVGEDVLFKAMMPSLIHAKKGGVWRLEGAMITTVFNTFNFVNTSRDPKVAVLKAKYGFDAEHPLLALPDLGRELRDDNFTPIKFIGDVIGMEVYLSTKAKFGSLDENLKIKFTRSPGLVNFDSDGKFAERTGVASFGDLDEARQLIGNRGDWSKMDTFTVLGRVKMVNPTLVGNVQIENYSDEVFDMDSFVKTTADMTAYGEVAPNGIGLTKDGKVRLNNAMIIVSKSGRVFVSPYNSGWAELTFEARKLLYDYLQKEFADKPIEINLTPAVTDLLLKQAGFDLKSKSLSSEAERDKKLKELLAELGLTPHEKVVTAQGKRTIVAVYSLLIAKGTDVSPATPAELKDYIEKASSSLLGEDGVPSSGIVEFGGVNAATRAIAYSYSQFDSNEILVTANSGSTNPQQYKLTFEKRIEGPRKVENLVIAKVEKLVATTDMRTGAVTENWVDLVSAVKGPDGEIIKAYQPDFFSDANLFTVSAKRGYVRFYATAAMTFSGMPAVDSLDISALRSLSGRNILVVEDDPIQGTLIGNFLGSLEANANVTLVTSAEEALKLLADGKKFDHYVFDNNLGQGGGTKSGLDLASERINAGDKTPMTFASTDFDKADSKESLALAALMAANPTITGALGKINNFNNLLALAKQVASSAAGQAVVAVGVPQLTQQANDVSSSAAVGGIDFDPSLLNLQIKRNGKGVPLPLDQQNLENINIEGLYPVIINMQPATIQNFPFLSSVEKQEKVPELSMR